mmetsp:Transcript_43198/g.99593  ORF Transcript_43198/g.99593 Transcript_43198/m.99593 type:complete len:147 (+) Transcript_43198:65-505(+)
MAQTQRQHGGVERLPCPVRIVDMMGYAFGVGCCGGFGTTFVQSLRNNPSGHRLSGAFAAARSRAPHLGGTFAMWSGIFHCFECAVVKRHGDVEPARRNIIDAGICGFMTAGLLSVRHGPRAASMNAVMGGFMVVLVDLIFATSAPR